MTDLRELSYAEAAKLPPEEFDKWLTLEDPDPPPPSAYPLHLNEGRCGFLESYIWRGEVALFEAVNHIWKLLNEPKNLRCIYIGYAAGTGGSGKWALAKFLRRALRESLDYEGPAPWGLPSLGLDEFHARAMDYFAASYSHYERTIQKYADILNGEPAAHANVSSKVITGPWQAATSEQTDLRAVASHVSRPVSDENATTAFGRGCGFVLRLTR